MLAETSISESTILSDHHSRDRRLADVKRGTEYYTKLDRLAEKQWKSNAPRFPNVDVKYTPLEPIMTSVLSDTVPSDVRHLHYLNTTSTPRQSISMMEPTRETPWIMATPSSHISLPNINIGGRSTHDSRPKDASMATRLSGNLALYDDDMYNPWGTSKSPLEDATDLTAEDMKPRELPFKFRDSTKIVVKPTPKQPIVMSRVAAATRDRHQRTMTNFQSRNGTIRVIKPLEPFPEMEKFQRTYKTEPIDPEAIEREKTFMMLERIDRILHPNRRDFRPHLGSSEEEIRNSFSDTITAGSPMSTEKSESVTLRPASQRKERMEYVLKRKDSQRKSGLASRRQNKVTFVDDRFGTPSVTIEGVLKTLDKKEKDVETKCEAWINRWFSELRHGHME
ncbi:hypothetical protein ACJMK2_042279 [Sinanodonta woodiana]|uniref:Uncharacterized protein n=1 Tax=Sinanodonta woodiana TaxID=1069815 RepID=A0ABD3W6T3_SINWO